MVLDLKPKSVCTVEMTMHVHSIYINVNTKDVHALMISFNGKDMYSIWNMGV